MFIDMCVRVYVFGCLCVRIYSQMTKKKAFILQMKFLFLLSFISLSMHFI